MMLSAIPTKRERWLHLQSFARSRRLRNLFLASGLAVALLMVAMLAAMIAIDAGIADRMIARWASRKLGREVRIEGLHATLLSSRPHLAIRTLTIGNPKWAPAGSFAKATDISARILPWSVLTGVVRAPELTINRLDLHLIRDKMGRNNWTLGKASPGQPPFGFLKGTDRLGIAGGHVDLRDLQHDFRFVAVFRHDPSAAAALTLNGSGELKGGGVTLRSRGGALNGKAVGRPYPFTARIIDGATFVDARGHSAQPFDLSAYSLAMRLHGPNLADLTYLFDLQTPNSAPYALLVDASGHGQMVTLTNLRGRVGASDFRGSIQSDQSRPHHRVKADLVFGRWSKPDIEAAFAETPSRGQARSSSGLMASASHSRWLLSDAPFPVERLNLVDVDSTLQIAEMTDFATPLTHVQAHAVLDRGVLTLTDVAARVYGGRVSGMARLDIRTPVPRMRIKGFLRGGELATIRPGSRSGVSGRFDAEIDLAGQGSSLHRVASDASGRLAVHVDQGKTSRAVDLMVGGDMLRAAGSLGDTRRSIQLDCADAAFNAKHGALSSREIVLQTPSGITTGTGSLNLATEQIDLVLTGHPTKKRLFQLALPVRIHGPFAGLSVSVLPAHNAAVLGLKGSLGVLMSPLAAIIPLKRASERTARCYAR